MLLRNKSSVDDLNSPAGHASDCEKKCQDQKIAHISSYAKANLLKGVTREQIQRQYQVLCLFMYSAIVMLLSGFAMQ